MTPQGPNLPAARRTENPPVPAGPRDKRRPNTLTLLFWALGIGLAVLLFAFNPAQHGFYPACLLHKLTGLQCPGCGSLRAAHELLHGNLAAAFRLNPLFVAALPFLAAWLVVAARGRLRGRPTRFNLPPFWLWAGVVLLVLFGVLRNV